MCDSGHCQSERPRGGGSRPVPWGSPLTAGGGHLWLRLFPRGWSRGAHARETQVGREDTGHTPSVEEPRLPRGRVCPPNPWPRARGRARGRRLGSLPFGLRVASPSPVSGALVREQGGLRACFGLRPSAVVGWGGMGGRPWKRPPGARGAGRGPGQGAGGRWAGGLPRG